MPPIVLAFEVHQPHRLRRDGVDEDADSLLDRYFDPELDEEIFHDVTENCYGPATERLLTAARETEDVCVNLSISTSWIDQAEQYRPELIDRLRAFPDDTIEFIGQTHYHSLAGLFADPAEFRWQLQRHRETVKSTFGETPRVVTNTELIYHDQIGRVLAEHYDAAFTEGAPRVLEWRSPNHVYEHPDADLRLLFRNRELTDDVGYRFSNSGWSEYPLTAAKYANWLSSVDGDVVTLFMDYETFGEHHWQGTGILEFLAELPAEATRNGTRLVPASDAARIAPVGEVTVSPYETVSWADREMDVSAWLGSPVQRVLFETLEGMAGELPDDETREVWRRFLTSDHLHHIATKAGTDMSVHDYFSPYDSLQEGVATLVEHLLDFQEQVAERR